MTNLVKKTEKLLTR